MVVGGQPVLKAKTEMSDPLTRTPKGAKTGSGDAYPETSEALRLWQCTVFIRSVRECTEVRGREIRE